MNETVEWNSTVKNKITVYFLRGTNADSGRTKADRGGEGFEKQSLAFILGAVARAPASDLHTVRLRRTNQVLH